MQCAVLDRFGFGGGGNQKNFHNLDAIRFFRDESVRGSVANLKYRTAP